MENKYTVYGLSDPATPEIIRYVGATSKTLEQRLTSHCNDAKYSKGDSQRVKWIRSLAKLGLKPVITVLEECDKSTLLKMEGKWIGNFRIPKRDHDQLNCQLPFWKPRNYYLSDRLKKWRGKVTQKEAADIFGVSVNTYRNWEYGVNVPGSLAMKEVDRVLTNGTAKLSIMKSKSKNE